MDEARRLAAEWIDHHVVHGDTGPTPAAIAGERGGGEGGGGGIRAARGGAR